MLFVLFFILRDGPKWFARVAALLPLAEQKRDALFTRLGKVLRAVVYGCGLTALAQGMLVTIGFAIAGLSGPIVFGVLASVLALLPFGGAALVWVPGVLYLFATGRIGIGIFLLAWGVALSFGGQLRPPRHHLALHAGTDLAGVPGCDRWRRGLRSHWLRDRTGGAGAGHRTAAVRRRFGGARRVSARRCYDGQGPPSSTAFRSTGGVLM